MQTLTEEEVQDLHTRVQEVTEEHSSNGGAYFELEAKVKELSKEIAKSKTYIGLKNSSISEEQAGLNQLKITLDEYSLALSLAKKKSDALEEKCRSTVKEYEAKSTLLKETESLVQTLTTGLGAAEGQENGYADQLTGIIILFYNCSCQTTSV